MGAGSHTPWWKNDGFKIGLALAIVAGIFAVVAAVIPVVFSGDDAEASDSKPTVTASESSKVESPSKAPDSVGEVPDSVGEEPTPEEGGSSPASSPRPQTKFLSTVEYVGGWVTEESRSLNGHDYPYSIATFIDGDCGTEQKVRYVEYQLDKQWRTFDTTAFLSRETRSGVKVRYTAYLDDSIVGKPFTIGVGVEKPLHLDVSNVGRLKLEAVYVGGADDYCQVGYAVWGDPKVSQ